MLFAITLAGAVARILYHYDRPFTADEVGTLINTERTANYLLTHYQGWLTQNYFILAEKVMMQLFGDNRFSVLLLPFVGGIAAIPLTAFLARMVASTRVALLAAALMAANPFLIAYSGILRGYSLLIALALSALVFSFRWYSERSVRNGIFVSLACLGAVLFHPAGVYVVVYIAILAAYHWISSLRRGVDSGITSLVIPLSASILLLLASYASLYRPFIEYGASWHDAAPTSMDYIPYVLGVYFGTGYAGWLSSLVFIGALLAAFKSGSPTLIFAPYLVAPVILMSVQGLSYFPWANARFLVFLLPICMIFIAEGIQRLGAAIAPRSSNVSIILAALLIATWGPRMKAALDSTADFPWMTVAEFIKGDASEHDIVLYNEGTEWLNLWPYLAKAPYVQSWLENYTEGQQAQSSGKRIFLVRHEPLLASSFPSQTFGKIQVIIYPPDSFSNQLVMIRDDILHNISPGKIAPELTLDYRNIWAINKKLGQDGIRNFQYYQLYMFCLQLTDRQMNIPRSLLEQELRGMLAQDVRLSP